MVRCWRCIETLFLMFSLQQVYLVYIFATVSQYCRSNVKFIDITLSLITISLFIFLNYHFRYYCLATASVSIWNISKLLKRSCRKVFKSWPRVCVVSLDANSQVLPPNNMLFLRNTYTISYQQDILTLDVFISSKHGFLWDNLRLS